MFDFLFGVFREGAGLLEALQWGAGLWGLQMSAILTFALLLDPMLSVLCYLVPAYKEAVEMQPFRKLSKDISSGKVTVSLVVADPSSGLENWTELDPAPIGEVIVESLDGPDKEMPSCGS